MEIHFCELISGKYAWDREPYVGRWNKEEKLVTSFVFLSIF